MIRRLGPLFAVLAVAACLVLTAEPSGASTGSINLYLVGRSTDVGDVTLRSDGTRVRVLIHSSGASISGVHVALAGSTWWLPQTTSILGQLPVARKYTPATTDAEVVVPVTSIRGYAPGRPIYVALYTDVVTANGRTDAAWGVGGAVPGTDVKPVPTVLSFDEVTLAEGAEQAIPAGYGGLAWDQVGIYNPNGALGYAVKSETNLAFIAEASNFEVDGYPSPVGSPAVAQGDMAFVGAWFSAAQRDQLPITVSAYDDGVLVGRKTIAVDKNGPTWFGFDDPNDGQRFESIDRLEMNANDGDPTTQDYFGFDDMTYYPGQS
jgi:hypothetical protein